MKGNDIVVIVQLLKDSPAVLSFEKTAENMGMRTKGKKGNHQTYSGLGFFIPCSSDNVLPFVAPGVTKDEIISASADRSAETSRTSALGNRVRQTASGNRLRHA